MAETRGARGIAASVVGWLIVAVVVYLLFGTVIGVIRWVLRLVVIVVVIGGLLWLWFRLRAGPDDP